MNKDAINQPALNESGGFHLVILCLVGLILYLPSLKYDFVYDDQWMIVENPSLDSPFSLTRFFLDAESVAKPGSGIGLDVYRPLATLSFGLQKSIFGLKAEWFRLINILLHLANAILLLFILRRTFPPLPSLIGALLFTLHPIQIESVVWVAQRSVLICTTGVLLAFWFWEDAAHNNKKLALCAAAYLFALLGKESALFLPILFLMCQCQDQDRRWRHFLVLGAVMVFYIGLRTAVLGRLGQSSTGHHPTGEFFMHGLQGLALYAKNAFWPYYLNVSYAWPAARIDNGFFKAGVLLLILLGGGLVYTFRRKRSLFIGWAAFFIFWLPHSGLFQLVTFAADRFMYLPMAGLSIVAAALSRINKALVIFIFATILLLGASLDRMEDWKNNESLWRSSVEADGTNAFAHANLAQALTRQGKLKEAVIAYETALENGPTVRVAWAILKNLVLLSRETNDIERVNKWRGQLEKTEERMKAL